MTELDPTSDHEVARPAIDRLRRNRAVRGALWIVGALVVVAAMWPTMSVPVQGDDLLSLFNLGPAGQDGPLSTAVGKAQDITSSFVSGETSHFYPLGIGIEVALKEAMLRAPVYGATASQVHQLVLLVIAIGTYASATSMVATLRRGERSADDGAALFAVPVALGFAASMQVTTIWSTYDPIVVHPVFGGLVTLLGVTYLMTLAKALQAGRRSNVLASALLCVTGICVYEGFYPFVAVATAMVLVRMRLGPRASWRDQVRIGTWTVGPGLALIVVTRLWSAGVSESTYAGTEVDLSLTTLVSWVTSMQSTMPGANWGRTLLLVPRDELDLVTPLAALGGLIAVAALAAWLLAARSPAVDDEPARPLTLSLASVEWLVPIAGMLLLAPSVFAFSAQWSQYQLESGATYMSATTAYWAWAMMMGVGLSRVAATRSRVVLGIVLSLVLAFIGVQQLLNRTAVAAEVEQPTPFGVDLVKILDRGTPLDSAGRCALLAGVPQSQQLPGWLDTLNREYAARHGVTFCE